MKKRCNYRIKWKGCVLVIQTSRPSLTRSPISSLRAKVYLLFFSVSTLCLQALEVLSKENTRHLLQTRAKMASNLDKARFLNFKMITNKYPKEIQWQASTQLARILNGINDPPRGEPLWAFYHRAIALP